MQARNALGSDGVKAARVFVHHVPRSSPYPPPALRCRGLRIFQPLILYFTASALGFPVVEFNALAHNRRSNRAVIRVVSSPANLGDGESVSR